MQFGLEYYTGPGEVQARQQLAFDDFIQALRSVYSHRPRSSAFKGVNKRGQRFEARNSPFPVCSAAGCHACAALRWTGQLAPAALHAVLLQPACCVAASSLLVLCAAPACRCCCAASRLC